MKSASGAWIAGLVTLVGCGPPSTGADVDTQDIERAVIEVIHPELQFTGVRDLVLAEDALWVLDGAPPYLTRVSLTDGADIQFGRNGQGPGEFRNPRSIQPAIGTDHSGVHVWDPGNGRVSRFGAQGALLDSEPLSNENGIRARGDIRDVSFVDPFRVRNSRFGFVSAFFPKRVDRSSDISSGSLRIVDRQLQPGPELIRFADHVAMTGSSLREWASVPLWDACEGTVVLWSPASSRVLWLSSKGRVEEEVSVQVPLRPVTLEDIETYLRQMARLELGPGFEKARIDYLRMARDNRDRFSENQPSVTDIRCESTENAWLRLFDTSHDPLGRSQTWIRVSRSGSSRRFTFHYEFKPSVFSNQGVFGLIEGADGSQRPGRWSGPADSENGPPSSLPE